MIELVATSAVGHHTDETRELAYQLWAFIAARNNSKVAELLESEHAIIVPDRTIRDWVNRYNWAQRAAEDVQKIAPDIRFQAFSELLFAGLDGARYIRRVNSGEEVPNKTRLIAALGAVDRIGFSPIGSRNPVDGINAPAQQSAAIDFSSMSPEELRAHEEQIRKRARSDSNTWVRVQR